jgi:hypothetical protein
VKTSAEVRDLLEKQRLLAGDELAAARSELASAHELARACERLGTLDGAGDAAALSRVAAERDALLAVAEAAFGADEAASVIWLLAARIMPSLREPRLRTRALRTASIRAELRTRFPTGGSGIVRHAESFDRALHAPMSELAARRAEAESLGAIATASVRHAEAHVGRVDACAELLEQLEAAGRTMLLFPPRTSLRETIAFEYRRHFGQPPG